MKRFTVLAAVAALLLGFALGGLTGCSEDMGQFKPNNPPGVELTATPPDSGTTRYDVEFHWTGWDSDGEVDYFLYAIDPPDMQGTDTPVWTRTDTYSGRFNFTAAEFDTLYDWRSPQVAVGWHVFVIKAVDDLGAVSEPAYLAFNAATIAPQTTITSPPPFGAVESYQGGPQPVGLRVTFRWEGTDVDGIFTDTPVGYYYRVADVTGESNWQRLAPRVWEDSTEWVAVDEGQTRVSLEFDDGHAYAVAIRAIDEARAVEPLLLLNKNMLWVGATERNSLPEITLESSAFGVRTWRGWTQDTEEYEVPLGSMYEFSISGDAGWYGGLITGYSFGWNLPSLDITDTDPDGIGAWTPWSSSRTTITARFTEAQDQFLYIRCKDDGGGVSLATIHFSVIALNPTRNLCYIDDWRKYTKTSPNGEPLDDSVWREMLRGYNYGVDWSELVWDEWDMEYEEDMPSLRFLSQFKVVVWSLMDNRMISPDDKSAWYTMNYLETVNVLAVYLGSEDQYGQKGRVWAFGRGLVESSVLPRAEGACEYPFEVRADDPLDACSISTGSFAYDLMHIQGDFQRSDPSSGGTRIDLFDGNNDKPTHVYVDTAGPAITGCQYTREPAAELYPNLPPVLELHPDWQRYRFNVFEVLEYPRPDQEIQEMFCDPWSGRMTNLVPLYRYNARSTRSKAHDKYCGFRYIPAGLSDHGEFVYFFFPMFPFKDDQIRETAKVVLSDWFGLPDPDGFVQ